MFNPETLKRLEVMTDCVAFEVLCCDLLAGYGGYQGIIPQGVGRIDGGKDAILVVRDDQRVSCIRQQIIFHFSLRQDYRTKPWEDLKITLDRKLPADLVVFVTNRMVTPEKQERIKADAQKDFALTSIFSISTGSAYRSTGSSSVCAKYIWGSTMTPRFSVISNRYSTWQRGIPTVQTWNPGLITEMIRSMSKSSRFCKANADAS